MHVARGEEEKFDIPLTPLIDMMFMLLIFFLVSTTLVNPERDLGVNLVDASESDNLKKETNNFIVNIRRSGIIVAEQTTLSFDELRGRLEQVAKQTPGRMVEIRADKVAPYGTVARVLQACRELKLAASLPTRMRDY
ncbi:MAG: biopolymer transporter ExbD [Planctomycetota bacterium]